MKGIAQLTREGEAPELGRFCYWRGACLKKKKSVFATVGDTAGGWDGL